MTNEARNAVIRRAIQTHTVTVTASQQTARASLVREGIYTPDGKLAPQYATPTPPRR